MSQSSKGSGFMGKMKSLGDKMKVSSLHEAHVKAVHMKDNVGKFANIVNPNHRHDEEHEKITDEKRSKRAESHRFQSFAPERDGNNVKWYVDARDYFWNISVAFEAAKETIYIEDWWLSPELFLRRPPSANQQWRLDACIKRAAERGVKIYIVVYKEVEAAVSCNSAHTKNHMRSLCPEGTPGYDNINVMRHPDHNVFENAGDMTLYWAHHEKFIVIDYSLAFIGGLDLCYGRWDTRQHPLSDVCPAGVENTVFPGQDYNNNRIMDFKGIDDWMNNELSKAEFGRMPWHDVHMGVIGPCVYDIAEHFILRWNFVKRDKYKRDDRFDWLTLQGRDGEDEDLVAVQRPKYPVGEYLSHPLSPLSSKPLTPNQGTVKAQIVRSSADWSSGILTEHSIQNAYKQMIEEAEHFVYIENQFFITATGEEQSPIHNTIGASIVAAIVRAHKEKRKFRIIIVVPAIPGFAGDLRSDAAAGTRAIMDYQYKSLNRGEHSVHGRLKAEGIDPHQYIFAFNLRSYDRINYTPAMKEQEEISGVKYQDVQRANAEEIMADAIHNIADEDSSDDEANKKKVAQKKESELENFKDKKRRFEEAREKVGLAKFNDVDGDLVADSRDSIALDAMAGQMKPSEELWNKDHPDTETDNIIQEELYPHDKVMIVDDRIAICGSSNINDRSQLGFHDSELAIVMEDTKTIDSKMNGQDYKAGAHIASLRRMLWREHLGLLPAQELDASDDPNALPPTDAPNDYLDSGDNAEAFKFVEDPMNDEVWDMWTRQATENTKIFRRLFRADPDDNIKTFEDYSKFVPAGMKQGHLYDEYIPIDEVKAQLDKIRGHLVWMPLHFLCDAQMAERGLQVNAYTESIYT